MEILHSICVRALWIQVDLQATCLGANSQVATPNSRPLPQPLASSIYTYRRFQTKLKVETLIGKMANRFGFSALCFVATCFAHQQAGGPFGLDRDQKRHTTTDRNSCLCVE